MWGAGAEQGGILQTSSGKMELKEPYYRMSQPQIQPQAYAVAQDQQPQQLIQVPVSYTAFKLNLKDIQTQAQTI